MKTVATINPEKEYENAKKLVELAGKEALVNKDLTSLDSSLDNLITAARVLMEREDRRRSKKGSPPPKSAKAKGRQEGDKRAEVKKLPSQRYPNLEVKESVLKPEHAPICPCCNEEMKESGLFDTTEKLETVPQSYYIQRTKRVKFNCGHCHGAMVNTPAQLSIIPTSNYGDSFVIDTALGKYCDLIPVERIVQIAYRNGIEGLPPQSLIGLTHQLANFLHPIYLKIKAEVQAAIILQADETTHKMLEGDETCNWYLWGFFCFHSCYFETHGTRSGDVVINFLKNSLAEFLVSDGYTGYAKAIRVTNKKYTRNIAEVHCNAHAYRYFKEASKTWKEEAKDFLSLYGEIYELERILKSNSDKLILKEQLSARKGMLPLFEKIKGACEEQRKNVMPASALEKATKYFLNHYQGLTLCTSNIKIPLDNNLAERELRAPVVGRKTWYGTHSKKGARTSAILFSIVQSCKLNNINPRNYFPWVVQQIHKGEQPLTPHEYSKKKSQPNPPPFRVIR